MFSQVLKAGLKFVDWFIPNSTKLERSDLSVARNFVFTHLVGPLSSQFIGVYLYRTDPNPGFACWTIILAITSFWALPFVLKYTRNLQLSALISVETLTFVSLFGTYWYGGVSSPFLPWLLVALLLGFFYLSDRPLAIMTLFALNFLGLVGVYLLHDFPEIVPVAKLASVGWMSILVATVYMSWMAIYYNNIMSMRSEVERETERHRLTAEKLAEAKRDAEQANHAKSIFLAKMSHEFRTPLNAIIGYSELILESLNPDTTTAQKEKDLQRINAAGKHLLSLVNDVLDLSKIESETIEILPHDFSLDNFCDQVVANVQPLMKKNANTFNVQRPNHLDFVHTDETKLRQVVLKLLSNAAKFTKNGTVTLVVKRQMIEGSDWIEFQVKDDGIGIDPSILPKLFQNFQQASTGTSRDYGGTGLGLSISQKLCTLLGGEIVVSSALGKGSTFLVRVPSKITAVLTSENENQAHITNSNLIKELA